MDGGFIRAVCAAPVIRVADCEHNAQSIITLAREAAQAGATLTVFPELCITGATCGDLFFSQTLLDGALGALQTIAAATAEWDMLLVVGLPLRKGGALYNCAPVLYRGEILGVAAKQRLAAGFGRKEARYFTACKGESAIEIGGKALPFGSGLVFACTTLPEWTLAVEIGEEAPAAMHAGTAVIARPCASPQLVGSGQRRQQMLTAESARRACAILYANAGQGESTQDFVYAGERILCENGRVLEQSQPHGMGLTCAEPDLQLLCAQRRRAHIPTPQGGGEVLFSLPLRRLELHRSIRKTPFVPDAPQALTQRCAQVLALQSAGLEQRLRHIGATSAVLGVSGGLDSALALIVTVAAFDALGLDRGGIQAVSMPCFGTTPRTRSNAQLLSQAYGVQFREIDITASVRAHFRDIGQEESLRDTTYENAQARERTQVLMDIANQSSGVVVGTGDLSELALGWATYNGDHMSMYAVNSSVPKTLVRHLVAYAAQNSGDALRAVLLDILDTPVSPELLPPEGDAIVQQTEGIVGPYELHDFFLYYLLRFGFSPKKIFRLAVHAFAQDYSAAEIKDWLVVFLKRFFTQQFKRSCMPDGVSVGSISLSPRAGFPMPSDASYALWLREAQAL